MKLNIDNISLKKYYQCSDYIYLFSFGSSLCQINHIYFVITSKAGLILSPVKQPKEVRNFSPPSLLWVSQCFVLYEVKLLFHNFAFASQLQNLDKKWDHPLGKECFLSQSLPQKNGGKSGSFQAIWPIGRTRVLYPATFGCNEGEILSNHTSHQKGPGTTFIR